MNTTPASPRPLALVTGASAGIGLHISRQLAARGYDVAGVGSGERIGNLAQSIGQGDAVPIQADLATEAGVETVWECVERLGRPLDVAVLNAGRSLGGGFLDTDLEVEIRMLNLNVVGQVRMAKHVVRAMAERRSGRILITSSVSALTPTPFESIYGPTRAFMFSFAQGLREELKERGVSVTALLPGATATDFHHTAGMSNTVFASNEWKNDPELVARRGLDALFAEKDHVIGGDVKTRLQALMNKITPERTKAARFARSSRPLD